nr:hypothetical protein [uncultured Carboxylicivirga sp.]
MKAVLIAETKLYDTHQDLANAISGMEIELPCSPSRGMLIGLDFQNIQNGLQKALTPLKYDYLKVKKVIIDDGKINLRVKPIIRKKTEN